MKIREIKHKGLVVVAALLAICVPLFALGAISNLTLSNGTATVTGPSSTTLNFPIARSGDTSFDAYLQYQTQDGTAVAGVNYTPASGSIVIPAGQSTASIPVTILGRSTNSQNLNLQMVLLGGGGGSFTPSFSNQQTFAAGAVPEAVAIADVNGDYLLDLIVTNGSDNTLSVLLNTTALGAATPSFAPQQTFATGITPVSVTTADLNGDGKPDLIVANQSDGTISMRSTPPARATPR